MERQLINQHNFPNVVAELCAEYYPVRTVAIISLSALVDLPLIARADSHSNLPSEPASCSCLMPRTSCYAFWRTLSLCFQL